jgi:hypothetical protein
MKFKSDIEVQAGLKDSSGAIGTSGQVLSSTGSNVSWINQTTIANDVQNLVKAGVAINKGQAVYVTGADGTNIIVGLASNATEATSSKTLGLLNATVAINGMADVVQIGRLAGLNTIGAVVGDPVWLGTNGNLIYGLTNKPYAPAHLVFIGVVTRVNANNGEIFVTVQNGFELNEIHDVDLKTTVPVNGDILGYNGTLWVNKTIAGWLGYTPANASGTTNYVSKFTGTTTLGNSLIFDNGTNVGIGTASPAKKLDVIGAIRASDQLESSKVLNSATISNTPANASLLLYAPTTTNYYGGIIGWAEGNVAASISAYDAGSSGALGLSLATGNNTAISEKMRITDTGNVGIGTTNPTQKLHIGGVGSAIAFDTLGVAASSLIRTVNDYDLSLYCGRGTFTEAIIGSDNFRVLTSSTERMRITPTGNVGIGTSSPSAKLDVFGNQYLTGELRLGANYAASGTGVIKSNSGVLSLFTWGDSTNIQIGGNDVIFKSEAGSERMRLTSTGNLGIGTSSPISKLHTTGTTTIGPGVFSTYGTIQLLTGGTSPINNRITYSTDGTGWKFAIGKNQSGTVTDQFVIQDNGNVGIGTTTPGSILEIKAADPNLTINQTTTTSNSGIKFQSGGNPIGNITTQGNNGNMNINMGPSAAWGGFITFQTDTSERMRITSAGNLGIGISSPLYKTDISGNLRFTTGYLNSNNCFERVFPSGISFPSATANLAADIILGNVSFWGYIEVEVTGYYSDQSSVGKLTKLFAVGTNPGNLIYTNESRVVDSMGTVPDNIAIGNMSWDATNSRFRIPISHIVSTGNSYTVKVRMLTEQAGAKAVFDAISISSNYTLTALTKQYPYYNNRLGVGNASPEVNLDIYGTGTVQARIQSASGGDIRFSADTFGRVGTYSASDLALLTSGTEKVRITTAGNVGIGTTAPGAKLHVVGNTYIQSGILYTDTIGSYSTGSVTLNSSTNFIVPSGNIGIGTASPSEKLTVLGNGMFYNSTTSWAPNTAAGLFLSGSSSGGASFISTYLDTSTLQIGAGVSQKTGFIINGQTSASGSSIAFRTGGTESMQINSLGEILIGQTSAIYSATNRANLTIGKSSGALIVLGTSTSSNGYLFFNNIDLELSNSTVLGGVYFRTNGNERMRINSSGNVGIGTSNPIYTLDVNGTSNVSNSLYVGGNVGIGTTMPTTQLDVVNTMNNPTLRLAYVPISGYGGGGNIDFVGGSTDYVSGAISWKNGMTTRAKIEYVAFADTMTISSEGTTVFSNNLMERMRIDSTGQVGIGTSAPMYTLHVNGSVAGTSAYVNLSDERYKKDVLPIENALDKVLSLNGVTFNWNKEFNPGTKLDDANHIGLIAQDVEKVIPQAVSTGKDGNKTKSVAYTDLVPVLIEAIKEQQKQIEELKKLINK